jgi:hypothetical protein
MKTMLRDTSKFVAAAALAMVKFHEPSFDKVVEDVDLAELVSSEDVQAATEKVIKKFDI